MAGGQETHRDAIPRCNPGDLGQEGHRERLGHPRAATPSQRVRLMPAVWTRERRQIFHHPHHGPTEMLRHPSRAFGHLGCVTVRCGDHQHGGGGEVVVHVQRNITRPRRQIQHHVSGGVPRGLFHHLPDSLAQHGAAPHDGRVVADEKLHGHHVHPGDMRGHPAPLPRGDRVMEAQQVWHTEAIDVAVQDGRLVARVGQCAAQVDGDGGLAHAPLAADDGDKGGAGRRLGARPLGFRERARGRGLGSRPGNDPHHCDLGALGLHEAGQRVPIRV